MSQREDTMEQVNELAANLREFNDTLEEASPVVLPEVARFLNNCKPLADLISDYLAGSRFQAAIRFQAAQQIAIELLKSGRQPTEVAEEANRVVRELERLTK